MDGDPTVLCRRCHGLFHEHRRLGRAAEVATEAARRLEAAREYLVTAELFDDPDAIQPHEFLTLGATPEEIHRAYNRFGARFAVDAEGVLSLTLILDLEEVEKSLQEKRTF